MVFTPILMEDFQSNPALERVKIFCKFWLLNFELLRFNFYILLQLTTALTAFCRALGAWINELAQAQIETSLANITVITYAMMLKLLVDVYQLYCEVYCVVLLLGLSYVCYLFQFNDYQFSTNEDIHVTYLILFLSEIWEVFVAIQCAGHLSRTAVSVLSCSTIWNRLCSSD